MFDFHLVLSVQGGVSHYGTLPGLELTIKSRLVLRLRDARPASAFQILREKKSVHHHTLFGCSFIIIFKDLSYF